MRDGERMRVVVGDDERIGNGDCLYGAERGAEPRDGDIDGNIGDRWHEVGIGDDHDNVERAGRACERNDYAEGNGIGAEPVVGFDGDSDERCGRPRA